MREPGHRRPNAAARAGLRAVTALTRALGRRRTVLADTAGLGCYAVMRRRRSLAIANHRRLDPAIGEREARRRARASFREFGRTVVDFVWATDLPVALFDRNCTLRGGDLLDAAVAEGRGVVLVAVHHGSWDMATCVARGRSLELTTVMADVGALTPLVMWARQCNGIEVLLPDNALRPLRRALAGGGCVALMCDLSSRGPTVEIEYCGGPVRFSSVPAWLAQRAGAPLMPVESWRDGGRYQIRIHPRLAMDAGEPPGEVMARVAAVLEPEVRRRPEQWYPFGAVYTDHGGPEDR